MFYETGSYHIAPAGLELPLKDQASFELTETLLPVSKAFELPGIGVHAFIPSAQKEETD